MAELDDPSEALRFEGYFTGTFRPYLPELAMPPDADDGMRKTMQEDAKGSELKLRDQDGLIFL